MIVGRRLQFLFSKLGKPKKQLETANILIEKFRQQKRDSIIEIDETKKALKGIQWRAGFTNEVEMKLFMAHDCQKSQYIFAIMNYSELGFKKISSIYLLDYAQYEYQQLKKMPLQDRFPLLHSRYQLIKNDVLIGEEQILTHLIDNFMLKYYDMAAPQNKYVLDFIDKSIKQPLETLFWNPQLCAQNSWDGNIKAYRADRSYVLLGLLRMNIQKIIKLWWTNIPKIRKNKQQYQKSKGQFIAGIQQFCKLLQNKRFAGGEQPNHIDFYLYSIIKSKDNSRSFRNFIQREVANKFLGWYRLMNATCQYNPQRITLKNLDW